MTHVFIDAQRLRVQRSGCAQWIGRSVDVPLSHVAAVTDARPAEVRRWSTGIRVAGIQIPGLIKAGLFRQDGRLAWWDVRRGSRVLVITLRDEQVATLVIEVDDPAAVNRSLNRALTGTDVPSDGSPM